MTLLEHAEAIARAALSQEKVPYGPWQGAMRSISADRVPADFIPGLTLGSSSVSRNFLYMPRSGYWRRRGGTVQRFDTFGSSVGLLPAKWSSKCRQLEEFSSDTISDGIPTLMALLTRETVTTGLDDGRFSNVWIRDQFLGTNYTIGSEYNSTTYPAPGTEQTYKYVPLWYDSGDGGITRGASEFARRFFFGGSRRFLKVGSWHYFPTLLGTPSRWKGTPELSEGSAIVATGDVAGTWTLQSSPTPFKWFIADLTGAAYTTAYQSLATDESPSDIDMVFANNVDDINLPFNSTLSMPALSATFSRWRVRMRVKLTSAYALNHQLQVEITLSDGNTYRKVHNIKDTASVGSWTTLDLDYNTSVDLVSTGTANRVHLRFTTDGTNDFAPGFYINQLQVIPLSAATAESSRLFPTGPIPPTHAGTITTGDQIESTSSFIRPDADTVPGAWSAVGAANLFAAIDETSPSDTDYMQCVAGGATCELGLTSLGVTPAPGETVKINYRSMKVAAGSGIVLGVDLYEGANLKVQTSVPPLTSFENHSYTLTDAQIDSISDWTNLSLKFNAGGSGTTVRVSYAAVEYFGLGVGTSGGWRGSDRFYYSVAYRFEDDSIWMPVIPRGPNDNLTAGYNLFTVDTGNATAAYESLTWSNIPIGPHGTKSRILLRTPKIDSRTDSTLQLNATDLRIVWEIKDNTTTTYEDFYADDDSLGLDVDRLFIRDDHIMAPRARYIFGGDMRVCVSYGGLNPSAITIAPVGHDTDYDLNVADDDSSAYGSGDPMYMRLALSSASPAVGTLLLGKDNAGLQNNSFTLTGLTLEELVDKINATTSASTGGQWRAQICPGANPQANAETSLTPHSRAIASCVVSGQTITKAGGGLSKVAVGNLISGTGVTTGAYVSVIDSDTQLTFVGTITPATITATFYTELGDSPTGAANAGYQRVIANSLPGFLYFNKTYLDEFPVDKSGIWMTVASPGSIKSAANSWSARSANKHTPPLEAGISMGGVAVDNGFVVPFSRKTAAIRNTRDSGTGLDSDYRIFIVNDARGCCAWNSVTGANRAAVMATPEGLIAADLFDEILISEAIFLHAPSARGDFDAEIPLSIAATAKDDDTAYLSCHVIRGALWVNYRDLSGDSHPNRQAIYDFSSGMASSGLAAFQREPGHLWGWSTEMTGRSVTAMSEGRRGDDVHIYGWNEQNAGSTGDGRIDELETTNQDNGTDISASLITPWFRPGSNKLSAQEVTLEHSSPVGATVSFKFHRSYQDDVYTLTPSTSDSVVVTREVKMLSLPARSPTAACFLEWIQTAGGGSELRAIELRYKSLPSYT